MTRVQTVVNTLRILVTLHVRPATRPHDVTKTRDINVPGPGPRALTPLSSVCVYKNTPESCPLINTPGRGAF